MGILNRKKRNSAMSIIEYTVLLSVISIVFFSMNTYMKRGIQERTRNMADYFINSDTAEKQVLELDPSLSRSETISESLNEAGMLAGGGTTLQGAEDQASGSWSRVGENATQYFAPGVSGSKGEAPPIEVAHGDYSATGN